MSNGSLGTSASSMTPAGSLSSSTIPSDSNLSPEDNAAFTQDRFTYLKIPEVVPPPQFN
ncbi:hypothetical protein BDC45DRAFT_514333 [Circinella umbellata]|nr:hypothetical protein BDC45DRAFT_514333 [Circinella umbellata]